MGMPRGSRPDTAVEYYRYLQGHHETDGRVATWHVDWISLAWLWGFVIVLTVMLLLWVRQYRTTHKRTGLHPLDSFGGWTTEAAGPATLFFLLLSAVVVAFAVALVVGHLVWGQKF